MDPTKAKLFLLPIKIDFWMVRSKEIKTTAFFYPILLHWLNIISWLLYFALLKQYRVMVGCSPFITVPLCCYLLLTLFSCMGLLLWWQSFPAWTVEECLLWCLEHLLSLLLWPWCSQNCLSHFFHLSTHSACAAFSFFSHTLSQRHCQLGWWAQLCPAVAVLKMARTGYVWHGTASGAFSLRSPLQPLPPLAKNSQYFGK